MDTLHSNCTVLGLGFCKVLCTGKILRLREPRASDLPSSEPCTQPCRSASTALLVREKLNTCPSIVCAVRLVLGGSGYLQTLAARWLRVRTIRALEGLFSFTATLTDMIVALGLEVGAGCLP